MQLRPVLDTSILFSATAWRGRPFQCVEAARSGLVDGVTCREILDELAEKLQFSPAEATDILADLLTFLRPIAISGALRVVASDPDDDKIIECAVVAGATHVVTSDRRHLLPLDGHHGIRIVNAADFLATLSASAP